MLPRETSGERSVSLIINHNAMAATTARTLNAQYGQLATATQRLSSGLRVNSAADDAAGLAIRELQRADIATLRQGARNANDAVSLIQTADGALQIIDEKLIRMKELAEQAATGTYDSTQRLMIDSEFQAMAAEINRIADATDFNGIHLLNGNLSGIHNGDGLNSAGAAKIHFGTGNDCAEDYYYIQIGAATTEALFQGAEGLAGGGAAGFDMLDSFRLPFLGDPEGQNVMALPNGNALILVNDHADRSLRMFEYTSDGTLVRQQTLPNAYPGDPAAGTMQPKECIVLPDGNMWSIIRGARMRSASSPTTTPGTSFPTSPCPRAAVSEDRRTWPFPRRTVRCWPARWWAATWCWP